MSSQFEVVVSGISGRFPDCNDMFSFKERLYNSSQFISDISRRWPDKQKFGQEIIPQACGMYTDLIRYDSRLFKLNSFFGQSNDIINRKVLEPSFEAIVDAGINPYSLDGRNIGVFMSTGVIDAEKMMFENNKNFALLIGGNKTMLANRISFAYNLKGPSLSYHLDPLGSVQAFEAGFRNIADGTVEAAIVGVASNLLDSKVSLQFSAFGLLSPDGLCRAFDKSANGYGRSESAVLFFLQRAEDAKRVYGSIIFSDAYYLGLKSCTFLGQDEVVLKNSLECIYQKENISNLLSKLAFIEMNAFGNKKFEIAETNAISDLICKNRKDPLLIGSIKSNVGHTEGSAALMSILKALLTLDSGIIAPNINFSVLNPDLIALKNNSLQIVEKKTKLLGNVVGVNSIGLSGMVNYTMLKQNSKIPNLEEYDRSHQVPRLLLICGRTEPELKKKIEEIEALPFSLDFISLTNDVFSSFMPFHVYRGYTILPKQFKAKHDIAERGNTNRPIWFVFSGMGSQWNEMGKELFDIPIFSDIIERCIAVLKPKGIDLYHILTSDDPLLFGNIIHSFVAIISMQIALFEILKIIGIKADGIIGHSVGENACAYADGCLTLEQAVLASYERGMASINTKTIKGMMAAVGKGYNEIKDSLPEEIAVACHNSAESCTLSGPAEKINEYVKKLKNNGIFARSVDIANIAYHSQYIAPAAPQLLSKLKKVIPYPKKRSSKWISTSVPECEWDKSLSKYCSAEYLTNNLLNPVLFEEGSKHIPENAIVIEIAPHGLLQAILKRSLPETCTNISLTGKSKTKENITFLLSSIGKLYIAGCEPNINALFPKISYPVPRGTPSISPYCTWHHEERDIHEINFFQPTENVKHSEVWFPIQINKDAEYNYLQFHKINNNVIIPPSLFMYLTWHVFAITRDEKLENSSIKFENVKIHKNLAISIMDPKFLSVMIQASGNFEVLINNAKISDGAHVILSGQIEALSDTTNIKLKTQQNILKATTVHQYQFYNVMKNAGYYLTDIFALMKELSFNETECIGKIVWNGNWVTFLDSLMKFQMYSHVKDKTNLIYPYSIRKLTICNQQFTNIEKGTVVVCHDDFQTKTLLCDGLEMCEFVYKTFPSNSSLNKLRIRLEGLEFVSYTNPRRKNIKEFFELSFNLAVQNLSTTFKFENSKLNIVQCIADYAKIIHTIVNENNHLKEKISCLDITTTIHKTISSNNICLLLVTNNINDIHQFGTENFFILLAVPIHEAIQPLKSLLEITKQTFDNVILYLLKKKTKENINFPIYIDQKNLISKNEIKFKEDESEFIIRNQIDSSNLKLMLSDKNMNIDKKYLFIMDDEEKTITNGEKLIISQIIKNLSLAVLKDGEWGNYYKVSDHLNFEDTTVSKKKLPSNIQLESVRACFVCIDTHKNELKYNIEYSGVDLSGKRIIGLTSIGLSESTSKIDPFLVWQIPKNWTLEDAVTVPFIYSQVYYILRLTNIKLCRSILINMGNEILFTEACIRLFLSYNFSVYVTVSDNNEAKNIKKKFPTLEDNRILKKEKCQYEIDLLNLTKKNGVNIVINCFSGMEHVSASLNCAGRQSYYFEIRENNFCSNFNIRLFPFLRSIDFFSIPYKISSLLKLPTEDKIRLQKDMQNGINSGIVIPFSKILLADEFVENERERDIPDMKKVIQCFPKSIVKDIKGHKLRYDNNCSYIIVGECKRNDWIELIKWLVTKGARKFIIVLDNFLFSTHLSYQINKLLNKEKIIMSFVSSNNLVTVQKALTLITQANATGILEAIFFISIESANKKIQNMNLAMQLFDSKNSVHFLSIFSGGLQELESRRYKGFPAIVFHSENYFKKLSWILSDIDYILSRYDPNNSPTLYRIAENLESEAKTPISSLTEYLPKNLTNLAKLGNDVIPTLKFKEIVSLSPPYSEIRGVYPIFVVPSLNEKQLNPLLKKLAYPLYCSILPRTPFSVADIALQLYRNICEIQSSGPITVISETWNATLIIELSSIIKTANREYTIFLLEGNPTEWNECLNSLGDTNSTFFENNLIKQIFHFDHQFDENELISCTSFREKINTYLSKTESDYVSHEHVIKAAEILRNRFYSILQHKPKDDIIYNTTLFLRHSFNRLFHNLSVTSNVEIIEADSYESFLQNGKISQIINENAAFSWWN